PGINPRFTAELINRCPNIQKREASTTGNSSIGIIGGWKGILGTALLGAATGAILGRGEPSSGSERDSFGRPVIQGARLEVDAEQAQTVRRIFERYAAGHSLKRIAIDLNQEGIVLPQPQKGRVARSWCPSSVRHILHNERYRGVVFWG